MLVACLLGGHSHRPADAPRDDNEDGEHEDKNHKTTREDVSAHEEMAYAPVCCSKDPVNQLDTFHRMASVLQHERESENEHLDDLDVDADIDDDFMDNLPLDDATAVKREDTTAPDTTAGQTPDQTQNSTSNNEETDENKRLVKMGMTTALAIGLHNFPEGLATFVAALNDPKVGSVLAIAIAVHNIPEGLCVALPIFYATGNRLKAFLWALLSGASEIVAALLGWAILANVFTDVTYAVLFGLVAGMMVIISIRELIPTAHFYDPEDTIVTYSFIGGMVVIALSLVLFQI